jgi:hypothetical protein
LNQLAVCEDDLWNERGGDGEADNGKPPRQAQE